MPDNKFSQMADAMAQGETVTSIGWFLRIRWFPALALTILPWPITLLPGLLFEPGPLSISGLVLLIANALLYLNHQHWRQKSRDHELPEKYRRARVLLAIQITLDWLVTGAALHWTGGIASPLLMLFIIHLTITSLLLPRRVCISLAVLSTIYVGAFALGALSGKCPWHPFLAIQHHPETIMILTIWGCYALVAFSLAWISSALSIRLRRRGQIILELSNDLEKANTQLQELYSIAKETGSILELEPLLYTLAQRATKAMGARGCLVYLKNEDRPELSLVAHHGLAKGEERFRELTRSPGLVMNAISGESIYLPDTREGDDPWAQKLSAASWHSLAGAPIRGGHGVIGIIWTVCRRVTRMSREEAEFLNAAGHQMGIAIENAQAWQNMQELDEKKNQFVNLVTHELRSPLAVTLSLLNALSGGFAGDISEKQKELVARALNRTRFLETLVNDLLAMAEARTFTTLAPPESDIDLATVAHLVLERHELPAQEKKLDLGLEVSETEPFLLRATKDTIDRILNNLVANAVKYTPPGGTIRVKLHREEGMIVLEVRDTGIGIPAAVIPRLGEEFYRAPNARRQETTGTGLGLAIIKNLIEGLQGTIQITSQEGKGSTFTIRLPADETQSA